MTETREQKQARLARQYASAYGPFVAGDYEIGMLARAHDVSGEIVWSFRKAGRGPVTYVLYDGVNWPVEVEASQLVVTQ